ncbi:hypothetical protein BH09PLA1_BH09PLA1_05800 [soil metagenome]
MPLRNGYLVLVSLLGSHAIAGSVVHDGSLGSGKTLTGPNFTIAPGDGRQVGGNLFHSFSKLNLSAGEAANFTGPTSVRNVLARVTDGVSSDIDGTLRCSIPDANLFFMNPAGVVFGTNAALDIDGAFVITTADVIKLADGGKFAGDAIAANSVLTSADPSAFGFLRAKPSPVIVVGDVNSNSKATLSAASGKTLSIVAGDTSVLFAELSAPSGRINLISVGSPGDVVGDVISPHAPPVNVDSFASLGEIQLSTFATASISGDRAGRSIVRGEKLSLELGSSIFATTADLDAPPDAIDLALRDRLELSGGSIIASNASGGGAGAGMKLFARTATLSSDSSSLLASQISSNSSGAGAGGNLELHFRRLELRGTANIASTVQSSGAGGDIVIHGGRVTLSGSGAGILSAALGSATGISGDFTLRANSLTMSDGATIRVNSSFNGVQSGAITLNITGEMRLSGSQTTIDGDGRLDENTAGAIDLAADRIVLSDGATISGTTVANAAGGALGLTARSIEISGGASVRSTSFFGANAGLIFIDTQQLELRDRGAIVSSVTGSGAGGAILISADTIRMDSEASIDANTGGDFLGVPGDGPGGNVLINTRTLDARGGAVVSTATLGPGPAGSVTILASESMLFSGPGSGINSPTVPLDAATVGGKGGTIIVGTPTLRIEVGASIRAVSATTGDAGDIAISVDDITITGSDGAGSPSAISSRSRGQFTGAGRGGTIDLTATKRFRINDGATVTSASIGPGDSGSVTLRANDLSLDTAGQIAASADVANGGAVSIIAARDVSLSSDARITAAAAGTGGNISINAGRGVLLRDSTITAAAGNQGNIAINSPERVIVLNSTITAQAQGTGGAIRIDPRFVVLNKSTSNGLAGGQDVLVTINASNLLVSNDSQILTDRGVFSIDTDLAQSLVGFDLSLRGAGAKLQETCDVRAFGNVSSFTTVGAGGVTLDPAKPAPSTDR